MSYCPNCGAELAADASQCTRCDAIFTAPAGWRPTNKQPPSIRPMPGDNGGPGAPTTASPRASGWAWILAGAAYGVLMRALFGTLPSSTHGVMSAAFLVGAPMVVGAISVYGARHEKLTPGLLLGRPIAAVGLTLLGCAVTLMEGAICLALMAPLFLLGGIVGGFLMAAVISFWKPQGSQLGAIAVLPLLLLWGEEHVPLSERQLEVRQSVQIAAPPQAVWQEIVAARAIRPEELPLSLTHLIGVPRPVEGVNVSTPDGEVRNSRWERGVHFQGRVVERKEFETIRWEYVFDAHSFPPGSMDEHVAIGGRYFDLVDTAFHFQESQGGTRLEIVAHYRVTSSINFYAIPAAAVLGQDFVRTILALYKLRSETAMSPHEVAGAEP